MAQVLTPFIVIHGHTHGALSLTRPLPSSFTFFFLPFSVFFLYPELFLELDNPIVMASLRYSTAEEGEDAYDVSTSLTGYEPNVLTFGELKDSWVSFSFMIPSLDQDVDDLTLGGGTPRTSRLLRTRRHVSQSVVVVCNVRSIRAT